jgi:predicted amidohydrolase
MKLRISLAQLKFRFRAVNENVARATEWIKKSSDMGSDLVLFPELWASGYDLENWVNYATPINGGVFKILTEYAIKYKITIGSSLLEAKDGRAYNTFVLHGCDGQIWGIYRKIHRFRLLQEEKWLGAGDALVLAKTPWGLVGLSTCYDLRFPEMFRPYAAAGARLTLIVAEWPERRAVHWSKLLQARAIENQMFLAGVNKVGESQGVRLGGRSAVVDPWGNPLVEGSEAEELLTTDIDLMEANNARRHIPVFRDRRAEIYHREIDDHFPVENDCLDD